MDNKSDKLIVHWWQASPVTMNELGSFIAIVGVHEDSFYLR